MNAYIFRDWLLTQTERPDRVGDLSRDVEADSCWQGRSPESLLKHLAWHGASDEARVALGMASYEWRRSKRLEAALA